MWFSPHCSMASIIGNNELPRSVIQYSERGGSSGYIVLRIRPSSTISLRCISNTRGAALGRCLCISLGRIASPERNSSRIQGFHLDSIRLIVSLNGQLRSTGIFFSYAMRFLFAAKLANIPENQNTEKLFHTRIIFRYLILLVYHRNFALVIIKHI